MNRLIFLDTAILLVLLFGLFQLAPNFKIDSTSADSKVQNAVLRLTLVGRPNDLNPISASPNCRSCQEIIGLEFLYGLPVMQNGSTYEPAGLFDWYSSGANSTRWDFNIRPGASWSDGAPITSDDVNFTFSTVLGLSNNALNNYLNLSSKVESITVLNASETEFALSQSQSDFGPILSNQFYFPLIPAHIWQHEDNDSIFTSDNFQQDVTDGPFFHLAYNGGPNLILLANHRYFNSPGVEEINVTFVSSENETLQSLRSNQADLAQINPQSIPDLGSGLGTLVEPERSILYMEYNISNPVFNDTEFRQALAYGINTSSIAELVYDGYATPGISGQGTTPPSATMWHSTNTTKYLYNATIAKSLLQSQGYSENSSGFLSYPNGSSVSFKIYTDSDTTLDSVAAEYVASYLRALGMQITIVQEPLTRISRDYTAGNGDIRNELVITSSSAPVFGFSTTDIMPGSVVYFPWSSSGGRPQNNWIEPGDQQSLFQNYENIAFSVSAEVSEETSGIYQQAVFQIDNLNSQYLPVIVLAYPDTIWAYRTDKMLGGLPSGTSILGFDMGGNTLDPYTFSQISVPDLLAPGPFQYSLQQALAVQQRALPRSLQTQKAYRSQADSQVNMQNNTTEYEAVTIIAVLLLIGLGTILSRLRKPIPPGSVAAK